MFGEPSDRHQKLQRVHVLDGREVAGNGADLVATGRGDRILDGGKGFVPGRRRSLPFWRT
jgi:hypothetical protein